jgi:serine/threonine protein kinase
MSLTPCPGPDRFAAWLEGHWTGAADDLFVHASQCADCAAVLRAVEAEVAWLEPALRCATPADAYLTEPECQHVVGVVGKLDLEFEPPAESPPEPMPQTLREYRLLEKLGQGGMGTVFRAIHDHLQRIVAIKVLPAGRLENQQAIDRFHREIKAIAMLDHPGIVRATDAGEFDGRHFLVMEYVEGLNLSQLVRRMGPLAIADACELACQTARGLEHARQHGLVHRDIKPSNLILANDGQLKILDLGLALWRTSPEESHDLTASGQIVGTAEYMAPEQFDDSHGVDIRADVYSLGCVLYYLLTGRAPFPRAEHRTLYRFMMAHIHEPVPNLATLRPEAPVPLITLIERMTAKSPAARFSTPAETAEALAPFAEGADVRVLIRRALLRGGLGALGVEQAEAKSVSLGTSPPASLAPTSNRWRWSVLGTGVCLLVLASVGWFARRNWPEAPPPDPSAALEAAQMAPEPAAVELDPQRDVALWVLAHQGELTVNPGGRRLFQPSELPAERFRIQNVKIYSAGVTSDQVAKFRELPGLQGLTLIGNPITDDAVEHLVALRSLRWLYVGKTQIGDAQLGGLSQLTNLESLGLEETRVTDDGLRQITGLLALRELRLGNTAISDASLANLKNFPALLRLDLSQTAISDDGINHLLAIPGLKYLNLQGTQMTDAAVSHLSHLTNLQELNVKQTQITQAGAASLRQALSNCRVEH